jgi:hypothetical protein
MTAKSVASGRRLLARRSICLFLASVFYLVCIVVFFQHNLPTFTTSLMGPPEDNMHDLWNTWYSQQLTSFDPHDWFFTDWVYYPEGASLLYHSFSYPNLALIRIARWLLDLPATIPILVGANNIVLLASFYLAAIAACLLVYHLTGHFWAAMLGGYIFAFSPYHFGHSLHHIGISTIPCLSCVCSVLRKRGESITAWAPSYGFCSVLFPVGITYFTMGFSSFSYTCIARYKLGKCLFGHCYCDSVQYSPLRC